ncbi:MAG: hypothetical protein AB7F91_02680 [Parvularculaceae bacterium]|nr:hypothetical protein [Parvularculaceae bacterium]
MAAQFYVRFVSRRPIAHARADYGIFGPAYAASRDQRLPDWLRGAIREELDWYEANLDVPARFGVVTRRSRRPSAGVCWFRPEAQAQIAHAYRLRALLDIAGAPIAVVTTNAPGDIVWRDENQIVAIPRRDNPVRFLM